MLLACDEGEDDNNHVNYDRNDGRMIIMLRNNLKKYNILTHTHDSKIIIILCDFYYIEGY